MVLMMIYLEIQAPALLDSRFDSLDEGLIGRFETFEGLPDK